MKLRKKCRKPISLFTCFTDSGISSVVRNSSIFPFSGCRSSIVMTFPGKLTFSDPKIHFPDDSLSPDLRKHASMSHKLGISCSTDSTPHPISSMNCVKTFAERHGSK